MAGSTLEELRAERDGWERSIHTCNHIKASTYPLSKESESNLNEMIEYGTNKLTKLNEQIKELEAKQPKPVDPAAGAKTTIDAQVDKLHWPAEKKARMKSLLHRIIDIAKFEWYRPKGARGKCRQWVDEFYSKVKDLLRDAEKDNIEIVHYGWRTGSVLFGAYTWGHEGVRITVLDDGISKPQNTFTFFLDDSWVGGEDHVFTKEEVDAKWSWYEVKTDIRLQVNQPLDEMKLGYPIGPGDPPKQ